MKTNIISLKRLQRLPRIYKELIVIIITTTFFITGTLLLFAEFTGEHTIGMFVVIKIIALILIRISYSGFRALNG